MQVTNTCDANGNKKIVTEVTFSNAVNIISYTYGMKTSRISLQHKWEIHNL